jgi:hypothetical protein
MAFAENLRSLPSIAAIEKLDLMNADGKLAASIENKPGQAGSLAVYHHLAGKYGAINALAAKEGLALYAELREDAEQHPGKHPNIDRLFKVIAENLTLSTLIHPGK